MSSIDSGIHTQSTMTLTLLGVIDLTFMMGKRSPLRKLAVQLTSVAMLIAYGRAVWSNNSAVINQGMDPGPIANDIMKNISDTTLRYLVHSA